MYRATSIGLAVAWLVSWTVTCPAQQGSKAKKSGGNQPHQIQSQLSFYRGMGHVAWFSDTGIKQHLGMTNDQFDHLSKLYTKFWDEFSQGINGSEKLTGQQQAAKRQELMNAFSSKMMQSAQGVLGGQQLQRYRQLHMQSLGFDIFNIAEVQQTLGLNTQQRQTLQAYAWRLNQKLNEIPRARAKDPTAAGIDYNALRKENDEVLNNILRPAQLQTLQGIWGDAYNFPSSKGP